MLSLSAHLTARTNDFDSYLIPTSEVYGNIRLQVLASLPACSATFTFYSDVPSQSYMGLPTGDLGYYASLMLHVNCKLRPVSGGQSE